MDWAFYEMLEINFLNPGKCLKTKIENREMSVHERSAFLKKVIGPAASRKQALKLRMRTDSQAEGEVQGHVYVNADEVQWKESKSVQTLTLLHTGDSRHKGVFRPSNL